MRKKKLNNIRDRIGNQDKLPAEQELLIITLFIFVFYETQVNYNYIGKSIILYEADFRKQNVFI